VALVLRLLVAASGAGLTAPPSRSVSPDQVDYEATAWELAGGHGFAVAGQPSWFRPPGTSFLISVVYALAGRRSYAAARLFFVLLSTATCAAIAFAGRRAAGAGAGLLAAWMLAVDPAHAHYAAHFASEVPYALLIVLAVWAALVVVQRARNDATTGMLAATAPAPPPDARAARAPLLLASAGCGLLLGAAILVRPQALLVLPLALAVALLTSPAWRKRALRAALAVAVVAALLPAAWVARNGLRLGHWSLAAVGATTLYGANNAQVLADPALCGSWASQRLALGAPALPRDEALYATRSLAALRAFVRTHARELPHLAGCKLARLASPLLATPDPMLQWGFAISWLLVAPLALLGTIASWRRDRARTTVVLLPLLALLVTTFLFYGSIRFRHSSEPLLVLLAAEGALAASAWAADRRARGHDAAARNAASDLDEETPRDPAAMPSAAAPPAADRA
jgi:4-amino-4-deoxy-L-arabinose transferase-like glycosyltransferase